MAIWIKRIVTNFLTDIYINLKDCLCDRTWFCNISFMADMFQTLNELSLSLQGIKTTVFNASNKISAYRFFAFQEGSVAKKVWKPLL